MDSVIPFTHDLAVLRSRMEDRRLKSTPQREQIFRCFVGSKRHLTAEELHRKVVKKYAGIGLATVYRTLNLLCESGLAQSRHFGDGEARFEYTYNYRHHDHLVCLRCAHIIEFENCAIEKLQEQVARRHRFKITHHRLELYGVCAMCRSSCKE